MSGSGSSRRRGPAAGAPPGAPPGGPPSGGGARGAEVVHRGVRWRRPLPGRISWYNEGLGRWVLWSPGQDAPPLPPGWEGEEAPAEGAEQPAVGASPPAARPGVSQARERPGLLRYLPSDAMSRRRPMTSPYRWVPLLVALAIVAVAVYQATRPPAHASTQDVATAEALKGKCLAPQGAGSATYSTVPVSCAGAGAAVRVVAVVLPSTHITCPKGSLVAQLARPGVAGEPFECLEELHKH